MHDLALPSSGDASGAGNACLFGLSLCSGAGGLDLGLAIAIPGYRAVGHVERETFAAATLVARMEDASLDQAVVWDDVGTFDGRPWRGAVDIVTAGYPCQPFSVAGKRRGADDPRHLWPHVARIIGEIEPPFVFLENVAHHLRLGFPEVASGLVGMGYKLAAGLFTAAEVGAPHKRERLFILAIREGDALAVESAAGQWEIVQAGAAELIAPGRYRLTRLLRGQRGTEHAMGNPAPAGARVVVLDNALASLPIAEADLGLPWNWRVGPAARAVSDASYAALGFTPTGRGLVPFAPVHVEQPWRTARSPGDLTIRWTRQSRVPVADAWEQVEVPLAEDLESYDVQILDGAVIKRTLTSTTTSVLYAAAQQTADWGAPFGPGQTLSLRIFQLSNRLGRGTPASVILQF